jgi:putative transposase
MKGEVLYLYLDATFLAARWVRAVENVSALVAYGVGKDGQRKLLGISIGLVRRGGEARWSELLSQLVERDFAGLPIVLAETLGGQAALTLPP